MKKMYYIEPNNNRGWTHIGESLEDVKNAIKEDIIANGGQATLYDVYEKTVSFDVTCHDEIRIYNAA